jgi:hypothetical protein
MSSTVRHELDVSLGLRESIRGLPQEIADFRQHMGRIIVGQEHAMHEQAARMHEQTVRPVTALLEELKQMSSTVRYEVDVSRPLRESIRELPQEIADIRQHMRRIIIGQTEARAELDRIVARLDTADEARRELVVGGGGASMPPSADAGPAVPGARCARPSLPPVVLQSARIAVTAAMVAGSAIF